MSPVPGDLIIPSLNPGERKFLAGLIRKLSESGEILTAAHLALEDELVDMRDRGMSIMGPANGLVIRYRDGTPSDAIRLGTRDAVAMTLRAVADHLEKEGS